MVSKEANDGGYFIGYYSFHIGRDRFILVLAFQKTRTHYDWTKNRAIILWALSKVRQRMKKVLRKYETLSTSLIALIAWISLRKSQKTSYNQKDIKQTVTKRMFCMVLWMMHEYLK